MSNLKSPGAKPAFSFANLVSPKANKTMKFGEQPKQSSVPSTPKKSGLEAYARKGRDPLPVGFAEQLLECEMQFQLEEIPIETVNKLTELYSMGMVYYEPEHTNKYKYLYFATKLQDLMLKPNVKEAMVKGLSSENNNEDDKEMRRMRLENQVSRVNAEKEAYTIVKSYEHKEKEINKVLEGDLSSQKDKMKKRLAERKARSQSRPHSVTHSEDNLSTTEESMQELEKELEGLPNIDKRGLQDIEEVDEARYTTPPRKRNKDGVVVLYQKRKSLKPAEPQPKLAERGYNRRFSMSKEEVVAPIIPKRSSRAASFGNKTGPPGLDILRRQGTAPIDLTRGRSRRDEIVEDQKDVESSSSDENRGNAKDTKESNEEIVSKITDNTVELKEHQNDKVEQKEVEAVNEIAITTEAQQAESEQVPEPVQLKISPQEISTENADSLKKEGPVIAEKVQEEEEEVHVETVVIEEPLNELVDASVESVRERRESEVADEKRLFALKEIEQEQNELLEGLVTKQEGFKEELKIKTAQKFKLKRVAMEEDMEDDEKTGVMWQKILSKLAKDEETELNKALEQLEQEQKEELETYNKKLQQQKMLKIAELSD